MTLDPSSPIPLHAQLKDVLKQTIERGEYKERIPSEQELIRTFAVSRTTVREAVAALVRDGVLQKIHGKGTFVRSHRVNEWLGSLRGFTETIEGMGMKPGIRLLRHGVRRDPRVGKILGASTYYAVERLRFADDEALALERTHYPLEIGLRLAKYDLNTVALYSVLEADGVILRSAEQKITAAMPTKADAMMLEIDTSTPVLATERIIWNPGGKVVEYSRTIFRADKYAFCVKMHRKRKTF